MSGKSQVALLIEELRGVCRRPLFTEICLDESKQDFMPPREADKSASNTQPLATGSQPPVSSSTTPDARPAKRSWREVSFGGKSKFSMVLGLPHLSFLVFFAIAVDRMHEALPFHDRRRTSSGALGQE